MFGFLRPERLSSAGVWIAPQAATTARLRTVSRWPEAVRPSMPRAAPPSTSTRSTLVRTTSRPPRSWASASHVFVVDIFAPTRQPSPQ